MKKKPAFQLLILLLFFTPTPSIAEVSVNLIAYNCQSCHSKDLQNLTLSRPISAEKLAQTLLAFKYNKKPATVMDRITKGYSDAELRSVANYFSKTQ